MRAAMRFPAALPGPAAPLHGAAVPADIQAKGPTWTF